MCCVGTTGDRFLQRCESIEDKRTFSIVVYNIVARKGLNAWRLFFNHFYSALRQPAGRADRAGSQDVAFAVEILGDMHLAALVGELRGVRGQRYEQGEFVPCKNVDTYHVLNDPDELGRWLRLHERGYGKHDFVYGASKLVVQRGKKTSGNGQVNAVKQARVLVTFIPPLICELCRRTRGRNILEVSVKLMTNSDQDTAPVLPPHFNYEDGASARFKAFALTELGNMVRRRYHLISPLFLQMSGLTEMQSKTFYDDESDKSYDDSGTSGSECTDSGGDEDECNLINSMPKTYTTKPPQGFLTGKRDPPKRRQASRNAGLKAARALARPDMR